MSSKSSEPSLQTSATCDDFASMPLIHGLHGDTDTKESIRAMIADLMASGNPNQATPKQEDVFLYPKGMCAIGTVARLLSPTTSRRSEVVVFG
jgi:cystathionine gamma-synthase